MLSCNLLLILVIHQVTVDDVHDLYGRQLCMPPFLVMSARVSLCQLMGLDLFLEQALGVARPCGVLDPSPSSLLSLGIEKAGIVTQWDLFILLPAYGFLIDHLPDP